MICKVSSNKTLSVILIPLILLTKASSSLMGQSIIRSVVCQDLQSIIALPLGL